MPDVFADEVGTYDLTITTSADWTVSSGGLPNGDNYVTGDGSVAATYNINGDDFDIRTGDYSIEFWVYFDDTGGTRTVFMDAKNGTSTLSEIAWMIYLDSSERVNFELFNTIAGTFEKRVSAVLATATWHYIVCVKKTGVTPVIYVNGVASSSSSVTATGTPVAPDGTFYLYFGTNADGTNDLTSGFRISKAAFYDHELSTGEMNDHYLAMVAS